MTVSFFTPTERGHRHMNCDIPDPVPGETEAEMQERMHGAALKIVERTRRNYGMQDVHDMEAFLIRMTETAIQSSSATEVTA